MYDKVNQKFYTNEGTSMFEKGEDVEVVNDNIRMYKKWKIKMYKNEYFYIP